MKRKTIKTFRATSSEHSAQHYNAMRGKFCSFKIDGVSLLDSCFCLTFVSVNWRKKQPILTVLQSSLKFSLACFAMYPRRKFGQYGSFSSSYWHLLRYLCMFRLFEASLMFPLPNTNAQYRHQWMWVMGSEALTSTVPQHFKFGEVDGVPDEHGEIDGFH